MHRWTRHCHCMAVDIHSFVQLHDMSEWRARETFTVATIFSNNPKAEISKWRRLRGKLTSPVRPAHLFGGYGRPGIAKRER